MKIPFLTALTAAVAPWLPETPQGKATRLQREARAAQDVVDAEVEEQRRRTLTAVAHFNPELIRGDLQAGALRAAEQAGEAAARRFQREIEHLTEQLSKERTHNARALQTMQEKYTASWEMGVAAYIETQGAVRMSAQAPDSQYWYDTLLKYAQILEAKVTVLQKDVLALQLQQPTYAVESVRGLATAMVDAFDREDAAELETIQTLKTGKQEKETPIK